jgi:hypothetical protein
MDWIKWIQGKWSIPELINDMFDLREKKRKEIKFQKLIHELGLKLIQIHSLVFVIFFPSFILLKPNTIMVANTNDFFQLRSSLFFILLIFSINYYIILEI